MNNGFVFATTGELYTNMARKSARNLKKILPDSKIDILTDQIIQDDVFSSIKYTDKKTTRPKMQALYDSRFEKTIYLDADVISVNPINSIFEFLDYGPFPMAMTLGLSRNSAFYRTKLNIPVSFPVFNCGIMAVKKTDETNNLLKEWEKRFLKQNYKDKLDQPIMRELLYERKLYPIALPMEYNFINQGMLLNWPVRQGPIKNFHVINLKNKLKTMENVDLNKPFDLKNILDPKIYNSYVKLTEELNLDENKKFNR